jgi:cytochrome c5
VFPGFGNKIKRRPFYQEDTQLWFGINVLPHFNSFFTGNSKSYENNTGEILFKKNCQFCHHIKGDDNYASAYYLKYRPKDFTNPDSWKGVDEQKITKVIQKGKGVMRAINLNLDETKAIIDYMQHYLKKSSR